MLTRNLRRWRWAEIEGMWVCAVSYIHYPISDCLRAMRLTFYIDYVVFWQISFFLVLAKLLKKLISKRIEQETSLTRFTDIQIHHHYFPWLTTFPKKKKINPNIHIPHLHNNSRSPLSLKSRKESKVGLGGYIIKLAGRRGMINVIHCQWEIKRMRPQWGGNNVLGRRILHRQHPRAEAAREWAEFSGISRKAKSENTNR